MSYEAMAKFIEGVMSEELEEQEEQDPKCPRCGVERDVHESFNESEQCYYCDDRDKEERKAWVQFACARLAHGSVGAYSSEHDASRVAELMLSEFRARFPYPAKPEEK